MKTAATFILSLTIVITLAVGSAFGVYSGGTGEPGDPYQIATKADLLALAANTADYGKCFILTANVNMQGQVFTKAIIAADTSSSSGFQGTAFTGTFDGNGHKITGFILNGNWYIGLFGQIDSGGSVRNLGLENFAVNGYQYVGGLVGNNANGSITNCYSIGQTSGSAQSHYIGGLAGSNGGSITNCYSTFQFSSYLEVANGGPPNYISGYLLVGGLVGYNGGSITNCYSTASVSGAGGSSSLGGLVGANGGTISNCFSTGMAEGESGVGGFAGGNGGNIINCHSTGQTNGYHLVIGGFSGKNFGSITNCYSTGIVSGYSGSSMVGGLVGDNDSGGSISNCFSTGAVSVSSNGVYVGGLVGGNYNSSISNCYSMGSVSGKNYLGGLVGRSWNGSSISNCFSTGQTSGSTNVGGLVGGNDNNSNISNSFWDTQTSDMTDGVGNIEPDPDGAMGKTTAQMQTQSTFTDYGWDFAGETANGVFDYWEIRDGLDYPRLRWQIDGDIAGFYGVNFVDYAVFAKAWRSTPSDDNWNSLCDLYPDNVIDYLDLQILIENWLKRYSPGDIASSYGVDFVDYAMIANVWGSKSGDGNWNSLCDLHSDGMIDWFDLKILAENWLNGN